MHALPITGLVFLVHLLLLFVAILPFVLVLIAKHSVIVQNHELEKRKVANEENAYPNVQHIRNQFLVQCASPPAKIQVPALILIFRSFPAKLPNMRLEETHAINLKVRGCASNELR
jgi:hypothetical protein